MSFDSSNTTTKDAAAAQNAAVQAATDILLQQAEEDHVRLEREKTILQKQLDAKHELWEQATTELQHKESKSLEQTSQLRAVEEQMVTLEQERNVARAQHTSDQERSDRLQAENDQLQEQWRYICIVSLL